MRIVVYESAIKVHFACMPFLVDRLFNAVYTLPCKFRLERANVAREKKYVVLPPK